jgi:hypothetical protein
MALVNGIQWDRSDVPVKKLQKMLWGRQVLQVFDDKLRTGIQEILACKKSMNAELKRVGTIFNTMAAIRRC